MATNGVAPRVLVLPGYGGSGPEHWQSLWEREEPGFKRIVQRDWENPVREEWVLTLEAAVGESDAPVLVAHSLACLAVAHWAAGRHAPVAGALLVSPPDPRGPTFPAGISGFASAPVTRLDFPSILVSSTDDPYATPAFSRACARAWGSRLVLLHDAGHINSDSGYGPWPQGRGLLAELLT